MDPSYVLNLLLLSGLAGLALFSASYALHMWRRRHAGSARPRPAGVAGHLATWGPRVAVLGVGLLVAALLAREFTGRTGLLVGDGLFAVRAHEARKVEHLAEEGDVEAGATLVRFQAPADRARARRLSLSLDALEAHHQVLETKAVDLDPDIVRAHADATTDRRQWRTQLASWVALRGAAVREHTFARLGHRVRRRALDVDLERLRGERAEARAEVAFHRDWLERMTSPEGAQATTEFERLETARRVRTLEARIERLTGQAASVERQRRQVTENLATIETLAAEEETDLLEQVDRAREALADAERRLDDAEQALAADRRRARALRDQELAQVRLEMRQVQADLDGLQGTLEVTAPFAGRVVYREPAPNAVLADEPVLVLAPPEGFRVHLRLPAREVEPLRRAGTVVLALADPRIQRRLPGRLLASHPLPHEPGYRLVELACRPPAETIRLLGREADEPIEARLLWRPPLWTVPLGPWAVGLIAAGVSAWVATSVVGRRHAVATPPRAEPAEVPPAAAPAAPAALSRDDTEGVIRMLGDRLAAQLEGERIDADLLSAVEWALDRHHVRAVRLLREALEERPEAPARLGEWAWASDAPGGNGRRPARLRLRRIARVVLPPSPEDARYVGAGSPQD
ncbi:MAG: HlyD family efflux transporter periplasmic adaptor subunit [Planctomycetota bacterium]